ncbi:MAG: trypsin-like serine protease, partial [Anaerolineae bacterium]|nr:trypsin-like serine protease [Anaerolineae bacterium]
MSKKTLIALLAAVVVLAIVVSSVSAITDGELDGEDHPYVVLLLMEVGGEPMYRCTGTLLSPTVLLTAGHCASNYPDEPYSGMRVFTESDVENGDNSYPYAGNNSIEAVEWYAHPLYETEDPFYTHDVGIVILEEPGVVGLAEYGTLPEQDQFDDLPMPSGKANKTWFTSVGYGQQIIFTDEAQWEMQSERIR